MTRRRLRPDELKLWEKVAESTHPLKASTEAPIVLGGSEPQDTRPEPRKSFEPFKIGEKSRNQSQKTSVLTGVSQRVPSVATTMDKRTFEKLKRGKLGPEAKIDLHGLTAERAHAALTTFIMNSYAQKKRLVLVITGKGIRADDGGPIPVRQGVLRQSVPLWLSMSPLASVVLQVTEAHGRHGGGGAYYVYLKRHRQ